MVCILLIIKIDLLRQIYFMLSCIKQILLLNDICAELTVIILHILKFLFSQILISLCLLIHLIWSLTLWSHFYLINKCNILLHTMLIYYILRIANQLDSIPTVQGYLIVSSLVILIFLRDLLINISMLNLKIILALIFNIVFGNQSLIIDLLYQCIFISIRFILNNVYLIHLFKNIIIY